MQTMLDSWVVGILKSIQLKYLRCSTYVNLRMEEWMNLVIVVAFADRQECSFSCMLCSTTSRDRTCPEHCSRSSSLATLSLPATSFFWCLEPSRLPLLSNSSATSTSTLRWTEISFDECKIFKMRWTGSWCKFVLPLGDWRQVYRIV